jgi:hypothetical protein
VGLSTESFGASGTVGGEATTARCTEDLREWFGEGGVSGGEGVVGGGDVFVGPGQSGQTVYGVSGNVGLGAGTSPVEAHGGVTYTVGGTFLGRGCPANSK